MVMNEEEVRELCVKLAEECYRLTATIKDTDKALWDISKALEGAQIKEKELLNIIKSNKSIIRDMKLAEKAVELINE
jgi:phosphoenolpyruvate-protein kinase (PTS system EI component)